LLRFIFFRFSGMWRRVTYWRYKKIGNESEHVPLMYKRLSKSPSRLLRQNSEDLTGQHSNAELQKTDILETAHI
jgi:hypothetical protein